jgi:thiol-disulfide isomerase/thioredoxin
MGAILTTCWLFTGCDDNSKKTKDIRPLVPTVGYPAPDIRGEDLEGIDFKLSDFKGKVILLDFWAMWCPPCVKFLPHGRQMVQEYKGRPFVALGVNNDDDPDEPRSSKVLALRCWADGKGGPITRSWGIEFFPTVFLIDHEGIIREKFVGDFSRLDEAVARLVRKAEDKS